MNSLTSHVIHCFKGSAYSAPEKPSNKEDSKRDTLFFLERGNRGHVLGKLGVGGRREGMGMRTRGIRMFGLDRMEGESNESDILIEGKLLGWGKTWYWENSQEPIRMTPGKTPGSGEECV